MLTLFLMMKRRSKILRISFIVISCCAIACQNNQHAENIHASYDADALNSILIAADSLNTFPFLEERVNDIKSALKNPRPVLLCKDSLSDQQLLAQIIALNDSAFTQFLIDPFSKQPYRSEVFGIYPARQSDMTTVKLTYNLASVYRVEMYNYALNISSIALVDLQHQQVLGSYYLSNSQPDIPLYLKKLAIKIAIESPELQLSFGLKPQEKDALMASTKTSLNRTRCERSRHLCVAPTFVKGDKALWAIVDLTDHRLVGIRWTNVGSSGPAGPVITEKRLQDDKITSCYCEVEQALNKYGWNMNYMLTSSDGLRISNVSFNNNDVLRSAKLVDWHVSYSGTDGFGYSDAVGCPYFSQAAVIAWEIPKIIELTDDRKNSIGFVLEQTFRSEGWPTPCNYNYVQRYEFYKDGKFRVSCASIGRGCGNTGTYRPVFRIAFSGNQNNFSEWNQNAWQPWEKERWNSQTPLTSYTAEGYQYKIENTQTGYFMEPGRGQFNDQGRGDFNYVYVTKHTKDRDEGENDLVTIGPCCNIDYRQGPEKFIEPAPENIQNSSLVIWYVAQLRNDDRKGYEYCWAENVLEKGIWNTKSFPCFCGPMFIPLSKPGIKQ